MSIKELLIKARQKLEKPENWCRFNYACDKNKLCCRPSDASAYAFCAMGAVWAVCELERHAEIDLISYLRRAASKLGYTGPVTVNDYGTHEDVLKMFDLAIQEAGDLNV